MRSSAKSVRLPPNKPSNKACSCRCQFCPTSLSSSPNHHPLLHSLSRSNPSCHFQPKTLWIGATACTPNNPFYHVWPTAWMTLGTCKIRRLGRVMGRVVKVQVVKRRVVKRRVVTFTEAKDFDYIPRQTFYIVISPYIPKQTFDIIISQCIQTFAHFICPCCIQ